MTAAEMREVDRRAREEFGVPEQILMEHAGLAVAGQVRRILGRRPLRGRVWVLAGKGANGGDGFVAARHLDNWGIPVSVALLAEPAEVTGSALKNLLILRRLSVPVVELPHLSEWRSWSRRQPRPALLVDALLGTGVSGSVREPVRSAILWINRRGSPVVSVDLPSGLSADTGRPCGVAVRADATVTCGLLKVGLSRGQGKRLSGRVSVADIALPRALR